MRNLRNLRLGSKVVLLGVGGVLLTVIALTAAAIWQSNQFNTLAQEQVNQLVDADLNHIVEGVSNLVKAQDEAVQQQVNGGLRVAELVMHITGQVKLADEKIDWLAVNESTQQSTPIQLPKLYVGDTWLGQNTQRYTTTPIVDQVQNLVGGTTTIFQRMNERGDMLRVATNILLPNGQRAIGTYIPAVGTDNTPDPVISFILRGSIYRGSAFVVDTWYDTAYEPIRDQSGQVVGMLYVGVKQESVESLRQAIEQTTVGKTGYVYVLGGQGNDLGKYIVSKLGQRDGENIWNTQDPQGNYVIRDIVGQALTLKPGETARVPEDYLWQEPGDAVPHMQRAYIAYYEPWHWVIVASASEDDFGAYRQVLQTEQANLVNVAAITGLAVALLIGLLSWLLARSISRPIGNLVDVVTQVAGGNLALSANINRRDEIGALARAFNAMTTQLRDLIGNLEQRVAVRTTELAQRSEEVALRSTQLETLNVELQTARLNAERRANQLATSAQIARAVSQVRDLDQLLSQVTRVIGDAFGFYHVGIFIVDEANRFAVLHAANSEGGQRMLARGHKLAVGQQGIVGNVTQTGLPRIALDVGSDVTHFDNPDLPDTRSEITLPLQISGHVLGALDIQTTQVAAFSEEDLTALGTLADQVAVAIENARLFTRTLAALQETENTNKRYLRDQWQRLIPALQQTSHEYHLTGVPAVGDMALPEIDQVLRRGEVVISVGDSENIAGDKSLARTALAVPIKLRDQIIGVIDLHETDADRRWTDDDVAVVIAAADQAALSLENARLLDETERAAQRERTINEINSRVRQTVNVDAILKTAVNELGRSLQAARVVARINPPTQDETVQSENGHTPENA